MTTQDLLNWALAQRVPEAHEKLVLICLAWSANPEGGGLITLEKLGDLANINPPHCRAILTLLRLHGLVTFLFEEKTQRVSFGLSVPGRAV